MRLLLLACVLSLTVGCCTLSGRPDPVVVSLVTIGESLAVVPETSKTLLYDGVIDRWQYNTISEAYNRAIHTYKLAVTARNESHNGCTDPVCGNLVIAATNDYLALQSLLGVKK